MKKITLLILYVFSLFGGVVDEIKDGLPDFVIAPDPIAFTEDQAVSGFVQLGPKIFRLNGTYGLNTSCGMFKVSGEYLTEKLGFSFYDVHTHPWLSQFAFGGKYQLSLDNSFCSLFEVGVNGGWSLSRSLSDALFPEEFEITQRKISGANFMSVNSAVLLTIPCVGEFRLLGLYDVVQFRHTYSKYAWLNGFGGGIGWTQCLGNWNFHLGAEYHPAFVVYEGSVGSSFFRLGYTGRYSIFAEKVQGNHHQPSSSRIGIAFNFDLGGCQNTCETLCEENRLIAWLHEPAVRMAQVLAATDQKSVHFWGETVAVGTIPTQQPALGPFALDVSGYFLSSSSLNFSAINLPSGFSIDPSTGIISGLVDGLIQGNFSITVRATNYFGSATQIFVLIL